MPQCKPPASAHERTAPTQQWRTTEGCNDAACGLPHAVSGLCKRKWCSWPSNATRPRLAAVCSGPNGEWAGLRSMEWRHDAGMLMTGSMLLPTHRPHYSLSSTAGNGRQGKAACMMPRTLSATCLRQPNPPVNCVADTSTVGGIQHQQICCTTGSWQLGRPRSKQTHRDC